jgi:hypothetical protein
MVSDKLIGTLDDQGIIPIDVRRDPEKTQKHFSQDSQCQEREKN